MSTEPKVDISSKVSDEVKKTTCYMCACRCGINVHVRDNKIRYIEGNRAVSYTHLTLPTKRIV